jgi:hypothetical protein
MAAGTTRIINSIKIFDRDGSGEEVDILIGTVNPTTGVAAPVGSMFLRDVAGGGTSGEVYIKTGAADTAWTIIATGGGSSLEEGYIRGFVGKSGSGEEYPEYSSNNVVTSDSTGSAGDGDNLEEAIGAIDAELGAAVTGNSRTNNPVSDQAINLNIEALDDAIGTDAQMTSTNYIALANTVIANLAALDAQVAVLSGQLTWIDAMEVVTGDDVSAFSGLTPTFSDNNGGFVGPLVAGQRVYSTFDDSWYVAAAGAWGAGTAAASGEQFFTSINLLDAVNQEQGAAFAYNGSTTVKVGDFDFELATTINLSGGYTPANGTVAASETIESAIEKLDANQADLTTLSGEAQGAVDHGTFTGTIIQDNRNTHEALQDLETELESIETPPTTTTTGIGSTFTTVDSVLVDEVDYAVWHVYAEGITDRSKKYAARISAVHNGTPSADATNGAAGVDADENLFLEFASNKIAGVAFQVICSGAGGAQIMELQAQATEAGGIDVTIKRTTGLDV